MKPKFLRPVAAKFPITSPFSWNRKLIVDGKEIDRPHFGFDFGCPEGTEIRAVGSGRINRVGWENPSNQKQGYGFRIWQEVMNDHGIFQVVYAHLSKAMVQEGMVIKEGEVIALSGNTGASTGPHLHWGARIHNTNDYTDAEFEA